MTKCQIVFAFLPAYFCGNGKVHLLIFLECKSSVLVCNRFISLRVVYGIKYVPNNRLFYSFFKNEKSK